MTFRFAEPLWLILLAGLPVFAWWLGARGRRAAVVVSSTRIAAQIASEVRARRGRLHLPLLLLSLACLIVALARPQAGHSYTESDSSGIDIMLVIDLSLSMWAHDFELNGKPTDRLTAVKSVVQDFIRKRPSDRLGLVAFGVDAYLVSPLTLNHDWLRQNLDRLELGTIDGHGTAIGSAIVTASNRLRPVKAESKVIILLTDGSNNAGTIGPTSAAEAAATFGIRIYSIGAGREGLVPMPRLDEQGQPLRDRNGRMYLSSQPSQIDFQQLENIAELTGGRAYRAGDTEGLRAIYAEIDQLEKTDVLLRQRLDYSDWYWLPLSLALALLLIDLILHRVVNRRLP